MSDSPRQVMFSWERNKRDYPQPPALAQRSQEMQRGWDSGGSVRPLPQPLLIPNAEIAEGRGEERWERGFGDRHWAGAVPARCRVLSLSAVQERTCICTPQAHLIFPESRSQEWKSRSHIVPARERRFPWVMDGNISPTRTPLPCVPACPGLSTGAVNPCPVLPP